MNTDKISEKKKFKFESGKFEFTLHIDDKYKTFFANAYFNKPASAEKLADYEKLCEEINKILPVKPHCQNRGGKKGEGKRVWSRITKYHLKPLADLENRMRKLCFPGAPNPARRNQ